MSVVLAAGVAACGGAGSGTETSAPVAESESDSPAATSAYSPTPVATDGPQGAITRYDFANRVWKIDGESITLVDGEYEKSPLLGYYLLRQWSDSRGHEGAPGLQAEPQPGDINGDGYLDIVKVIRSTLPAGYDDGVASDHFYLWVWDPKTKSAVQVEPRLGMTSAACGDPVRAVRIKPGRVEVDVAAWKEGDETCHATGKRTDVFEWRDGRLEITS